MTETTPSELVPVKDVVRRRLLPISYDKLLRMIRANEIPHVEVVGKYFLTKEIIADFIARSTSKPQGVEQ